MNKKIYVSDVFDIDKVVRQHGNKIMLIAGVGAGKSTWVKEVLCVKCNSDLKKRQSESLESCLMARAYSQRCQFL